MRAGKYSLLMCLMALFHSTVFAKDSPEWVDLHRIDPTILIDIRFATANNYIGRPISGYKKDLCLLERKTAEHIAAVQQELLKLGYSLKVYDCLRPQTGFEEILAWSQSDDLGNKPTFFPELDKSELIALGYVDTSKKPLLGQTVDVTIVPKLHAQETRTHSDSWQACYEYKNRRFFDDSVNMGSGYQCFRSPSANATKTISLAAFENRLILRRLMEKHHFKGNQYQWWHFESIG